MGDLTLPSGAAFVAPDPTVSATIISDASWCPKTKAGGWAVWIASSSGLETHRTKRSGVFHKPAGSSGEAERWSCYNGLWLAARLGVMRALVQTDCQEVVDRRHPDWAEVESRFPLGMQISWRHVKGHTSNKGSRFYVNRWCDREARKRMKEQRSGIKLQTGADSACLVHKNAVERVMGKQAPDQGARK